MKVRTQLILVIAMIAALLATTPAGAQTPADGREVPTVTAATALEQDIQEYAAIYGVSIAEAGRRSRLMDEIGDYLELVEGASGSRFAFAELIHEPSFKLEVGLVGRETLELPDPPKGLEVSIEEAPFSQSELEAESRRFLHAVGDLKVDYQLDFRAGAIEAAVDTEATRRDIIAKVTLASDIKAQVKLRVLEEMASPTADLYGGRAMSPCTTGFRITWYGQAAILTAGHCNNNPSYQGQTLSYIHQNLSGSYDRQANGYGTHTLKTLFNSGIGNRKPTGYSNRTYVGAFVCKYGKTTGRDCGTYTSISYDPSWVSGWGPHFGVLHSASGHDMSDPGDSGGPVYYSTQAAGIISGQAGSGNKDAVINRTNHAFSPYSYVLVT